MPDGGRSNATPDGEPPSHDGFAGGDRRPDAAGEPFRTIFRDAGIGIARIDRTGTILQANPALERILGYPAEALRGMHFAAITHPDDVAIDRALFDSVVHGRRERYRIEKRYVRDDGATIWGRLTASAVRSRAGEFRYGIGMLEDITDEKRAEHELRASEARARRHLAELEVIYGNAPVGLCVLDTDLRFLRVNDRMAEINGVPAADHVGRTIHEIVPRVADEAGPIMRRVVERGESVSDIEVAGETPARPGETRHWSESYFPIREDGDVVGLNVVVEEITHRKRAEEQLRRAKDQAEVLGRAKNDFLAVVSHELRTPLTAVVGYVELLDEGVAGELTAGQHQYVDRIGQSARHLRDVIDQILHVVELEAERGDVHVRSVDIAGVARATAAIFADSAREKGLAFRLDIPDEPVRLRTDRAKLEQILFGLLSNAVKFTREGAVELSVRRAGDGGVLVHVRDTGPGIAPEMQGSIFQQFTLAEEARTREQGGLGLGLAISRRLAQLLGGDIALDSTVDDGGSTFTIRLPPEPPRLRIGAPD